MDIDRADEIIKSKCIIDVYYNNFPVWIEKIENDTNQAMIKDIITDKEVLVDVQKLEED